MRRKSSRVKVISTDEAESLIEDGIPLIDVRTEDEFNDGHIPGAINIPLYFAPGSKEENAQFVDLVAALFAKDQPLILSCKAGARSKTAAQRLETAGFSALSDMEAGFSGKKDAFGRPIPGWSQEGRDIEMEANEEQTYQGVLQMVSTKSGT